MANREEVKSFIKENYDHEQVQENIFKLLLTRNSGRTQSIFAAVTEDELQVTSPVAWEASGDADRILDLNLSMFGLVKVNGAYGLKHNAFLKDIDESEIESAFFVLAFQADELEKALGLEDEF